MIKPILLAAAFCFAVVGAEAQTLTIPPSIAKTYENGTRSMDGKPGKKFWENHGHYNIAITVTPPSKQVSGVEHITYFNNSPDKLDSLNMKLIMNVHLGGKPNDSGAGITVDDFKVNGSKAGWNNEAASTTNYMIALAKPLMPHDSVKLDITWHYLLSNGRAGREGFIDSTTFYLAYFYPRVAVYDDYKGWDTQPHTGSLEFYNDLNNYKLSVTVPKNYIVWSTGTLANPNEVLQPEYANRLQQSFTSDSTIHIVAPTDIASENVTAQNATNTWVYTAHDISDMALGISNHYDWDAASVVVDGAGRRVSAQAAFDDNAKDFHHSVQWSRYSLNWFSHNLPGVPYPFEKSTAFQGFSDMEYPMMINDSKEEDLGFAELVQDHEQAHTYMPFYMSTNESYYAFMDEGWATTFEYLIGITEKGQKAADEFYKNFRVKRWIHSKHDKENPIITPSPHVTWGAGNNAYGKPSLSYLALKDMLGEKLFKKALHNYMNNWHGKHPIPWDYFNAMKAGSGKDLDWFFYNWFYTPSYIDIALDKAEKSGNDYVLSIRNIGGFAVPFNVNIDYTDGTTDTIHQTPIVWEHDQKNITVKVKAAKTVKDIVLDGGIFMDADESNNKWVAQ
jgi:hypothetical protein